MPVRADDHSLLGMSPLCGVRLSRCALSRWPLAIISTLTDFHPSCDSVGPAAPGVHGNGPFPCPRIAGFESFTLRVNDARLTN